MDAPVSLSAIAGMLKTQRAIFPVTRCLDIDGKPQFTKIGFHVLCSALAQHEIVRRCAEFIAAPFQDESSHPVMLQSLGIGFQDTHRVQPEGVSVKIEEDVDQRPRSQTGGVSRHEL